MNERIRALAEQATKQVTKPDGHYIVQEWQKVFAELMVAEFSDVVKQTANKLNEFYTKQGCSEEEVLMRVNDTLAVLGHIRERFKD